MTDATQTFKPKPEWTDDRHAPVIFFDGAPACGLYNGVVGITLAIDLARTIDASEVTVSHTVIAYLRTSLHGAMALRESLDRAILLATPTQSAAN